MRSASSRVMPTSAGSPLSEAAAAYRRAADDLNRAGERARAGVAGYKRKIREAKLAQELEDRHPGRRGEPVRRGHHAEGAREFRPGSESGNVGHDPILSSRTVRGPAQCVGWRLTGTYLMITQCDYPATMR